MVYDNKNRGALWDNLKKMSASHPDFKGELNVDGVDYWVSCWRKQDGEKMAAPTLKLSINKKENKRKLESKPPIDKHEFDDDIPF